MKGEISIQNLMRQLGEKKEKPEKILSQALKNLLKHDLPEEKIIKSLQELEQALKTHDEFNILFETSRKDKVVGALRYFAAIIEGQLASKAIEGVVNGIIQLFERK